MFLYLYKNITSHLSFSILIDGTPYFVGISQVYFLFLPCLFSFSHLLDYKKKLREYWLPRITDELIMIGSLFIPCIHMLTTSLGRHTL